MLFLFQMAILLSCILGIYRFHRTTVAPEFPAYPWQAHPNTLLVCYRPDCGCGISGSQWALEGIAHRIDVLIVFDKPYEEIEALTKQYPQAHLTLLKETRPEIIQQLSPNKKTTATLIRNGRIVRQASGRFDFMRFVQQ